MASQDYLVPLVDNVGERHRLLKLGQKKERGGDYWATPKSLFIQNFTALKINFKTGQVQFPPKSTAKEEKMAKKPGKNQQ